MLELYPSPWRAAFESFLGKVNHDLLIASPFIKTREADRICTALSGRSIRLRVYTDLRRESVVAGSLDVDALRLIAQAGELSTVFAVPQLHAKVYVRDDKFAIITSANLTPSGMDSNHEYGVGIGDQRLVRQIRCDIETYGKLGSPVSDELLAELSLIGDSLVTEYKELQRSANTELRRKFDLQLAKARVSFLRAQVGSRTAHALFADAILFAVSKGPLSTREIHSRVQQLLPELCDDAEELIIDGQRFGKRWKHGVRNAQVYLRRQGTIVLRENKWCFVG